MGNRRARLLVNTSRPKAMEKEDPGHFGHRAPADCHTAAFFHRCIERPQTVTQLRSFIGAVTSYSDTFPHRSHILAPLTKLAGGRGTVKWNADCQKAFDQVKAMLATRASLLARRETIRLVSKSCSPSLNSPRVSYNAVRMYTHHGLHRP
jgi:hypothetical protein